MNLLLDSWAWIEFFKGTEKGKKVKDLVKGSEVYTSAGNVYEVYYRLKEDEGGEKTLNAMNFMEDRCTILPIDKEVAIKAGEIRLKEKLRAIDAFTLAAARMAKVKVLTGDAHFKGIKDAIFLE